MPASASISGPAEALRRLGDGRDVDAWRWLVEELGDAIRRTTGRLSDDGASADDAAQEALLTIRDHARSFRPRAEPDLDARRWVLRVAANAALALRRTRRRARARDARGASSGEVDDDVARGVEREETARLVRDALAGLAEPERTAIVLRVVEGLGYDQIAAELRCAEGTAKSRVSRGLERLRDRLGRRGAVASIAALLAQPRCEGALASSAQTLIHVPHGATLAAVPATLGGLSMAAKLGIALALVAAVSTPVALRAQAQDHAPSPAPVPAVAGGAAPRPAAADPLAAKLDKRITFEFEDQDVGDVLTFFAEMTGVTISLAPEVAAAKHPKVTLKVKDMRFEDALKWVLELTKLQMTRQPLAGGGQAITVTEPDGTAVAVAPPPLPSLDTAPDAVLAQLKQEVHVEFAETDITDVVQFLQRVTNMNIVVDPNVLADAKPVTLSADRRPLREVLQTIVDGAGLTVGWRDGAVFIGPKPKVPQPAPPANPAPRRAGG